jgi:precorrin-8X/cobalt-precorrin-8 methylmutase
MIKDHPIFLESIRFIKSNWIENNFNYLENKVLERLVHTSGDFNIQKLLEFSEGACEKGVKSLKAGAPILTDTDMAAAAIKSMAKNTNGNSVVSAKHWFDDRDLSGLTKTAYGIEKGWIELSAKNSGSQSPIIVIGSSPTALVNPDKSLSSNQCFAETTEFPFVFFAIDLIAAAAISVSVNIGAPALRDLTPFSHAPSLNSKSF